MNQRRYIEKQHKLTAIELDNIKQQIENELNEQNNQTDSVADDVFVEEVNNCCDLKTTNLIMVAICSLDSFLPDWLFLCNITRFYF